MHFALPLSNDISQISTDNWKPFELPYGCYKTFDHVPRWCKAFESISQSPPFLYKLYLKKKKLFKCRLLLGKLNYACVICRHMKVNLNLYGLSYILFNCVQVSFFLLYLLGNRNLYTWLMVPFLNIIFSYHIIIYYFIFF